MKTATQAINDSGLNATLVRAIVRTVGLDSLSDIANYGADGGYPGLTWTSDTVAFYKRHKKAILQLAENMADDLGEDLLKMIANFGCLRQYKLTTSEVAKALYGRCDQWSDTVQNAMTWFAAEEVARAFED